MPLILILFSFLVSIFVLVLVSSTKIFKKLSFSSLLLSLSMKNTLLITRVTTDLTDVCSPLRKL